MNSYHIATNGKSVVAALPVRPLVAGSKLTITQDLVRDLLRFDGKLGVHFAAVY